MRKIIILQGIPGSGKSTYAKSLMPKDTRPTRWGNDCGVVIVSADDYFQDPRIPGSYYFIPAEVPRAHAQCLRKYVGAIYEGLQEDNYLIIVDNTNTTVLEVAPYMALAQAYHHFTVELLRLDVPDVMTALQRNTHKVPEDTIWRMWDNLGDFDNHAPPWWPKVREMGDYAEITHIPPLM